MIDQREFSNVTKKYLSRFYDILDAMIWEMSNADLTDSISHNFIVQMIPHHRAAVNMSCNLLQYTTLVPLQDIAVSIVNEQTKSIEHMTKILSDCSGLKSPRDELQLYMQRYHQISQTIFAKMGESFASNDINADFMREMIPHHKGAIQMSENALQFPVCPELTPILQTIVTSQKKGVQEMECLLQCI